MAIRVVVTGGRYYQNRHAVYSELDKLHAEKGIDAVIEGGASGADTHAAMWAKINRISLETYHASWITYGNRAGPIRNQQMIDEAKPDFALEFPGGAGTADMVRRLKAAGIPIKKIED